MDGGTPHETPQEWHTGRCGCWSTKDVRYVRMSLKGDGGGWQSTPLPMCVTCRKVNHGFWVRAERPKVQGR